MLSPEAVEFFSNGAIYLGVVAIFFWVVAALFNPSSFRTINWGNVLGISFLASLILIGGPVLCLLALSPLAS